MSHANAPSSLELNKALVIRWFDEVWNLGRRETIEGTLCCPVCSSRRRQHLSRPRKNSRGSLTNYVRNSQSFRFGQLSSLAEGDLACVHWSANFIHTVSVTPIRLTGTSVVRISDGQLVEAWQTRDAAGLAAQLQSKARRPEVRLDPTTAPVSPGSAHTPMSPFIRTRIFHVCFNAAGTGGSWLCLE